MLREDKIAGRQIPTLSSYFLWKEAIRQYKHNVSARIYSNTTWTAATGTIWHTEHQRLV